MARSEYSAPLRKPKPPVKRIFKGPVSSYDFFKPKKSERTPKYTTSILFASKPYSIKVFFTKSELTSRRLPSSQSYMISFHNGLEIPKLNGVLFFSNSFLKCFSIYAGCAIL